MILSRQPATSSTLRVTNPSSQRSQHLTGSFTLQDVCVVFFNSTKASYRAQFVSRRGERAIIHGFSERQFGFHRVATVRPAVANEYEALARCEQQPHAIAIYYSANNFFHQAFHAIPAWEGLHAVAGSAGLRTHPHAPAPRRNSEFLPIARMLSVPEEVGTQFLLPRHSP